MSYPKGEIRNAMSNTGDAFKFYFLIKINKIAQI